jgi:hypothetical protein
MRSNDVQPARLLAPALLACAAGLVAANPPAPPDAAAPGVERGTRLQGTAFINRNRKVPGASVLVRPQADATHLYVTSSDHEGSFLIDDLPDGRYRVEVRRDGMAHEIKDDIVIRFPFRAVIDLPMEPATAERPDVAVPGATAVEERPIGVTGRVVGRDGAPLADIGVRLARWDGKADPWQLRTAEDGTFDAPELLAGAWQLEVHGVGFLPIRLGVEFDRPAELVVVLVPQPADYDPSPLELMPPEEPLVPDGLPPLLIVE